MANRQGPNSLKHMILTGAIIAFSMLYALSSDKKDKPVAEDPTSSGSAVVDIAPNDPTARPGGEPQNR